MSKGRYFVSGVMGVYECLHACVCAHVCICVLTAVPHSSGVTISPFRRIQIRCDITRVMFPDNMEVVSVRRFL